MACASALEGTRLHGVGLQARRLALAALGSGKLSGTEGFGCFTPKSLSNSCAIITRNVEIRKRLKLRVYIYPKSQPSQYSVLIPETLPGPCRQRWRVR